MVLKLEKLLLFARWITLVIKSFRSEKMIQIQMVEERVNCFFPNSQTLLLVGMKMADKKHSYNSWHLPEDMLLHR